MSKSVSEAESARLMLLGLLSEASDEDRAAYAVAKREIDEVVARHGDVGKLALVVATAEVSAD